MSGTIRVFVDGRALDVPSGSVALDAVRAADPALADDAQAGRRVITDSRGLPIGVDAALAAGSILRLVVKRERGASDDGLS